MSPRPLMLAALALAARAHGAPLPAQTGGAPGPQVPLVRGWPLDRAGLLKVFVPAGAIRVVGWARDSVHVSGTITKGAPFYGGGGRGGVKLGIETSGASPVGGVLTVQVPASATVWVRGATTDVAVEGLVGSVDVAAVSGQVRISGAPADLTAEVMDGALDIVGSPLMLRAKTASATLRWQGRADDVTLGSVSGRVEARGGPLGRARVETISGDVLLEAELAADADLVVESHSGSVTLVLPAAVPARVSVDAARVTGAPGRPQPAAPGRRPPPRVFTVNAPPDPAPAASLTVRTFKGAVTLVPARSGGRTPP